MKQFMYETKETEKWQQVYESLADDLSKRIYLARSLYSLTTDRDYLKDVIRETPMGLSMRSQAAEHFDSKLALVGAGDWANYILRYFPEIHWDYIADNYKFGAELNGIPIIRPEDILKNEKAGSVFVVISILFGYQDIIRQLMDMGIKRDQILPLGEIVLKHQYFDLKELYFSDDEVFLDIGSYDGGTACEFARVTGNKYKRIICFEPNERSYELCRQNTAQLSNVLLLKKGASNSSGIVNMSGEGGGANIINDEPGFAIETLRLDDIIDEATFIKMDIEGAEMDALLGAERLIRKHRPKLAISVYHLRTDIWEIPKLLLSWHPDYRLYLRIYSMKGNDAVLYAI